MLRTWIALVSLGCLNPVRALEPRKALAEYSASVWTQQQGLPQDAVHAIAQTTDGYLWLGTDEGLARFDGYEFVSFNRQQGAPKSNSISALAAGKDGSLWIGSRNGLTRFKDGQFQSYSSKDGLVDNLVSSLFVDHAGILWIVAGGNLSRFDGDHFTNYQHGRELALTSVRDVTESPDHQLYIGGNSAILRLDQGRFVTLTGSAELNSDFPSHLRAGKSGDVWITGARGVIQRRADGGLKRYRRKEGLSDSFGLNAMTVDSGGTLWIGTDWGLARLEESGFRTLPETRDGTAVRCIFEDREQNLWVGTDGGLVRYRDDLFKSWGKSKGLPDNGPVAIHEDRRGRVWMGFDDGLFMMNGQQSPPIRILHAKLFVRHLRETAQGGLLVPSRQGLIRIRDSYKETFVAPDPQGRKTVFDALEGSDGTLWLALPNGLARLSGGHFDTVIQAGPLYQDDSFFVLAQAHDGAIWAGTLSNGLWRYDHGDKRLFTTADGLSSNQVRALYADADGTLWIGTLDGGLSAFRDGNFVNFRAHDGLPSDNIYSITDDGLSLWLSTPRGISRIPRQQLMEFAQHRGELLQPANYGVEDGLPGAQATDGRRFSNGAVWFATSHGVAIYDPSERTTVLTPPLVHIVELAADRRVQNEFNPHLSANSGHVQIRYTGIHLRAPDRIRYSYLLDGLDSAWMDAGSLRAVNFDNLKHGHYRFRVKAELPGGPSNESVLDFDIDPHYYETIWFRSLLIIVLGMLGWSAYKFRERQVRFRFSLVLQERARLAREVHDTLAQGFAGIASQLDVVEITMPAEAGPARAALDLARNMARHSLTEARRSLMDLRAAALLDQDLGVALESAAHRWTASSHVALKVDVNGDSSRVPEEVAHNIFRIAQEAVANALSHATPSHVDLKLRIEPKQLQLHVEDDGCGFEPADALASETGSFGLIGMRERAERIAGDLRLDSQPGKGTRVDVTVPLP
jgi:ligand-binding sensor domain-containing protein/two-component sensor histidine kinase